MTSIKTVILAAISALLLIAFALPATAAIPANWRVWDPVQQIWVHPDGTPYAPTVRPRAGSAPHSTAIPREVVDFPGKYKPGTIVVETSQFRLYYDRARAVPPRSLPKSAAACWKIRGSGASSPIIWRRCAMMPGRGGMTPGSSLARR